MNYAIQLTTRGVDDRFLVVLKRSKKEVVSRTDFKDFYV